ncbi:MAG: FAD:protein FMN transferase [Spirochaetota bacterium]
MGTLLSAKLICGRLEQCDAGFSAISDVLTDVDQRMSVYHPSEVTGLNDAAGTPSLLQPLSPGTLEVLRAALRIARQSEGRFDPTILPLLKAYGLMREDTGGEAATAKAQLAEASSLVDYRQVVISGSRAGLKKKGMSLDFGGIAKGYALDKISAALQKLGIAAFVLNFGGHLLVHGTDHTTVIYHPGGTGRVLVTCTISEGSISVSAQDKRYVTERGKRRGHLINPLTKESENETLLSLVYHHSAMHADAWSTALFFTGTAEFRALSEQQKLAALHLNSRGELSGSTQMQNLKLCTAL